MLFKPKKFGISETDIRPNRLYDKNTTVLQKWREKEPSSSFSLLRLYCNQCLPQRVRGCVVIHPFQHSGIAMPKQICDQVLWNALRRPERRSGMPQPCGVKDGISGCAFTSAFIKGRYSRSYQFRGIYAFPSGL